MKITFDPAKNRINLKKHQVDLADVDAVFFDPMALTCEDRDHDEERFVTLGMSGLGQLLVVAYTHRGEDEIRVFSARHAEPHERRAYEEG
ncbi:MAG: BrnT family toxin [Rhodocyclaceae bacterium]|nr:BrnT family toxin [Rhodocyclaceae bacterium]MDP3032105.1 BrnT family toxin [Rhodocyclaceae bacterium]